MEGVPLGVYLHTHSHSTSGRAELAPSSICTSGGLLACHSTCTFCTFAAYLNCLRPSTYTFPAVRGTSQIFTLYFREARVGTFLHLSSDALVACHNAVRGVAACFGCMLPWRPSHGSCLPMEEFALDDALYVHVPEAALHCVRIRGLASHRVKG